MTKAHILDEIRRAAASNGDAPLGEARFKAATGIKRTDWYGLYWARWGDAIREAGFSPNQLTGAIAEEHLLAKYAQDSKELHRLPTGGDLRMKRRTDRQFPCDTTFDRFGTKAELIRKRLDHCRSMPDFDAFVLLCEDYLRSGVSSGPEELQPIDDVVIGYVYLIKSGRSYKIGRSNSAGRRSYELAIQLPEQAKTVHVIRTDDPPGIEDYCQGDSPPKD